MPATSNPLIQRLSERAACYKQQENYPQAERFYKNALETASQDKSMTASAFSTLALAQTGLGKLYSDLGIHLDIAEKLFQDSIELFEKHDPDNIRIIDPLINLGDLYLHKKQYAYAEKHYQRALDILRQAPTQYPHDFSVALNNLAQLYRLQHRYAKAHVLFKESLELDQRTQPVDQASVATSHYNLAQNYQNWGKLEEADKHYRRALELRQQILPPQHPDIARTLAGQAELEAARNNQPKALALMNEATDRFHQYLPLHSLADKNLSPQQTGSMQRFAKLHLRLLQQSREQHQGNDTDTLPLAFQAIQEAHGLERMRLLREAALRLASSHQEKIRQQVQELWGLKLQREEREKEYLQALSAEISTPGKLATLQQQTRTIEADIRQLDAELKQTFPAYAQLINPEPLRLDTTQNLLRKDEALLVWSIDENISHLMVVRPHQAPALYPLNIGRRALSVKINKLMTPLTNAAKDIQQGKPLPPFDMQTAHDLYQQLLAPAMGSLKEVKHIVAVTDSALQGLPLAVLIKDSPNLLARNEYHHADWLINHYAFSYLPAVHSLADLRGKAATASRNTANSSLARKPFIGFGDPLLPDAPTRLSLAFTPRGLPSEPNDIPPFFSDPDSFAQQLYRLRNTAVELTHIAELLGADKQTSLYLAEKATETKLKQLSDSGELRRYNIISFATHALLPGENGKQSPPWLNEPGLVLTPPKQGTEENDGFHSASEAAMLDLDADVVLLSACNTGVPDPDGDGGLSELAKAFFTAGSRSVLASHWPVDSASTQKLMTHLFPSLPATKTMARTEALRLAMQEMANSPPDCGLLCQLHWQNPVLPAHPVYWAPFTLYGEGGTTGH